MSEEGSNLRESVEVARRGSIVREVMEGFGTTDPVEMARSVRKRMYEAWNEKRNR